MTFQVKSVRSKNGPLWEVLKDGERFLLCDDQYLDTLYKFGNNELRCAIQNTRREFMP